MNMPKPIAEAITQIMGSVQYVQKKGVNQFHNYKFAAIGDVLEKLQPAMAEAGLSVAQNQVGMSFIENSAALAIEYEFILNHKSGETWDVRPRHTGMAGCKNSKGGFDDKAANKCHTAARKYFLIGLFQIPIGDHADADQEEDKPSAKPAKPEAPKQPTQSSTQEWVTNSILRLSNGELTQADFLDSSAKSIAALKTRDPEQYTRLMNFLNVKDAA